MGGSGWPKIPNEPLLLRAVIFEQNKARYTNRHRLRGWGRRGNVRAGAVEDAGYTTASVTCNWAGAEIQKPLAKYRKKRVTYLPTYGRTDGRTHPLIESLARD